MSKSGQITPYSKLGVSGSILACAVIAMGLGFLSSGCETTTSNTTAPTSPSAPPIPLTYDLKIEAYSAGDKEYLGLYNNFEYRATLMNSVVQQLMLDRQTQEYQWDKEKVALEQARINQEVASETTVFVSFFTPANINDNLAEGKSIWRVYLEVGGHRYMAKVKKMHSLLAELQALYPYHTRWNTPYKMTFAVPVTAIETQSSTLTITGPLGTRAVTFSAL